jgi:hypothetical protein
MPTPISYLSGNTLSYQSGMVKKGTIGLNLTSSLTGNYRWWNGVEVTASQYLIYSDTYSTGASSESNVTPAAWSTPDLTDQSLLNLINTLPDRVGQTAFTSLSNALIWLNESGKYFIVKNSYENIVTSGLTLNLDAAWSNSFTTGSTFWYDLSGTGNTGTLTNGPSFTTQDGGAIVFDGTNDVVRVSQQGNSLKPTYFTTEAWVKLNSNQSGRVFIATFSESQSGIGMGIHDSQNNSIKFFTSGDNFAGYDHVYSTIQLNVGQWYHVTCTYDGSFKRIYINGVLNNFSAYTQTIGYTNNDFTVGGLDYNGSIIQSFDGNIAYARMYNRALSQSEILQNYHVTKQRFGFNNINYTNLVYSYQSNNNLSYPTTGTTMYDLAGNGFTSTLTNGVSFENTNKSLKFDGTDDYLNFGSVSNSGNNYTLIFTFKSYKGTGSNDGYRLIGPTGGGIDQLGYSFDNSDLRIWQPNWSTFDTTVVSNKVYRVAQVTGNGTTKMYNNGVLKATYNTTPIFRNLGFGQRYENQYGSHFNGELYDVNFYNRNLTELEILQNYYQGNIVTNGLIMNLDAGNIVSYGGTGTTWSDLTNTTTGATLTNGPTYNTSNGGSIVFDGTDDYAVGPSSMSISQNQPFTLEFWVNLSSYTNLYPCLLQIKTNTTHGFIVFVTQADTYDGITFGSTDTWIRLRNAGNEIVTNTWNQIVINYNGAGAGTASNYKMYLNTQEQTLSDSGSFIGLSQVNNIGTIENASRGYDNWTGGIANFKQYNRALTQSEVIQNFNAHKSRYGL